ncbi:UvrD-helicase domain-containing protein [Alistipes communis]|uniref:UvrD-helicase domain-containing protein n=1 Tax=Alistipes communis TaxID=2585118 RepID=UPI003A8ACB3B
MRAKILNASAGSGKTYQLAYKYVHDVIERPESYSAILAVTFTNKATEEMKTRILKEINTLASGQRSGYMSLLRRETGLDETEIRRRARTARTRILHNYSRFTVLTIDRFFQRILRAFIKELGIDLNYNIELETASVLTKSADALVEQITSDPELQRWLTDFVQERIDDGAKWDIRDGILALGDELFKERNRDALAAAGDKETLVRLVNEATTRSAASKQHFQAIGKQAVERMNQTGVTPESFKGGRNSFAQIFRKVAAGEIVPPTKTVRTCALSTDGWCTKTASPAVVAAAALLQPLLAELCAFYDEHVRLWNTAELLRENYRSFALLTDLYAKVRELCDEQNVLFLSETKQILSKFIGRNDAPFIYEKVGNRFERFMIDEFQDTSVKEWQNFLPLLHNAMAQSEQTSVLLVGDIKQSIYRWRGGDWKILHSGAVEALGADNVEVKPLEENWRSLRGIVNFNNLLIDRAVEIDSAALCGTLDEGVAKGAIAQPLAAQLGRTLAEAYASHTQRPCKQSRNEGYVRIETFAGDPPLIERIKETIDRGFRPKEIVVLVRGRNDGARVAEQLLDFKRRNDDPRYRFDIMTQEALVIGRAPVSGFVAAALRLAVEQQDSVRKAVYNRYLGRAFDAQLPPEEADFLRTIRLLSPEEAFEKLVMRYGLDRRSGETAYLQAIHEQIIGFSTGRVADIPLFLDWWEEQGAARSLSVDESESTIEIMTVHKAKGLEKKVVLIPYCNWPLDPKTGGGANNVVWAAPRTEQVETAPLAALGEFPVRYKRTMGESLFSEAYYRELVYTHVDNINLLYVALTRAVEVLCIFIPQSQRGANVGSLLLQSLGHDGDVARLGGTTGRYTAGEAGETFEFGVAAAPEPEKEQSAERPLHVVLDDYPTTVPDLRLRLPSDRYFEQGEEVELAPRNLGILMHRAFENAATREEIDDNIRRAVADAALSPADAEALAAAIGRQFDDPLVAGWFDGRWNIVRNENEIIVPHRTRIRRTRREQTVERTIRRPDRVMVKEGRAVVVDYKFGLRENPDHRRQLGEYIELLREIGYTQVEGYLWYVRMERIVSIDG